MPITSPREFGTNADGTKSTDYCVYCYRDGAFDEDLTMDEMIDHCVKCFEVFNKDAGTHFSKEKAIAEMKALFPTLKRWKDKQ